MLFVFRIGAIFLCENRIGLITKIGVWEFLHSYLISLIRGNLISSNPPAEAGA